jgi:hypothetical protein
MNVCTTRHISVSWLHVKHLRFCGKKSLCFIVVVNQSAFNPQRLNATTRLVKTTTAIQQVCGVLMGGGPHLWESAFNTKEGHLTSHTSVCTNELINLA